jgi:putative spermidine/putrescine transport system permease protein
VFAFPYALLIVTAAVQSFDWELDRAAQASGARWWSRVRDLIVPLLRPAILSGLLFAFIASFTELVFALFMHGLTITTLPVTMWDGIRFEVSPTTAAASTIIIIGITGAAMAVFGASRLLSVGRRLRGPGAAALPLVDDEPASA